MSIKLDESAGLEPEQEETARQGLSMYADQLPATRRSAFAKKLEEPKFHDLALRCYGSLGLAVGALIALPDAEFEAMKDQFIFLAKESLSDEDLAAMAMTYMVDGVAEVLGSMEMELDAGTVKRANKRAKAVAAEIKKATASRAA